MPITHPYHPWRALRDEWEHVHVAFTDLPAGFLSVTDGRSRIWMHARQDQAERRCTLAHELVHLERGDMGKCSPSTERGIDREVARRLIPISALMDAMAWSDQIEEIADELWVTPEIAEARIRSLLPAQVAVIAELIADLRS